MTAPKKYILSKAKPVVKTQAVEADPWSRFWDLLGEGLRIKIQKKSIAS